MARWWQPAAPDRATTTTDPGLPTTAPGSGGHHRHTLEVAVVEVSLVGLLVVILLVVMIVYFVRRA